MTPEPPEPPVPTPPYGELKGVPVSEALVAMWAGEAESGYDLPDADPALVAVRVEAIRTQMDADERAGAEDED